MGTGTAFCWTADFNTGITEIDEQHKRLVGILNNLSSLATSGAGLNELSHVLDELFDYAHFHFEQEEHIWSERLGGTAIDAKHQRTHRGFIRKLMGFRNEVRQSTHPDEIFPALLKFVTRWLLYHILHQDRRMALIAQFVESGGTLDKALTHVKEVMRGDARRLMNILLDVYSHITEMTRHLSRQVETRTLAEKQARHLAQFDTLTGLPNRFQLESRAKYALDLAKRSEVPLAVMFIDLDHFKDINDTLGHSTGDSVLVEVSQRLHRTLRNGDILARLGGDEFICVLYNTPESGATKVAQKLLDVLSEPLTIGPHALHVSGSIGVALYPEHGDTIESLMKNADIAMYAAKHEGRHAVRCYRDTMRRRSARRLEVASALSKALDCGQMHVVYQPQVSLTSGKVVGAEALLRWQHPTLGNIPPSEFIPIAEDNGLILQIGEWVLRQAVMHAKLWQERGIGPLVVAVNLSLVQLRQESLPDLVSRIVEEAGLSPEAIELELTESVAMLSPQGAIQKIRNLHGRGVKLAIDDFGVGYSSLSHLKQFNIDKLKIDQSFVQAIGHDTNAGVIVEAILNLAMSLGLTTIAEGVETKAQLDFLRRNGCDEVQGFYYAKAILPGEFEAFARVCGEDPGMVLCQQTG